MVDEFYSAKIILYRMLSKIYPFLGPSYEQFCENYVQTALNHVQSTFNIRLTTLKLNKNYHNKSMSFLQITDPAEICASAGIS